MYGGKIFRSKVLVLGLIGAFLLLLYPAEAWTQTAGGTGSIKGFIYQEDLRAPLENAVVKIRNTEDGLEKESLPTDESGAFEIKDIEEGNYVIGVTTAAGNFNFDYTVGIKANETAKLSMAVKPGVSPALGQGEEDEEDKKKGFFATATGLLLLTAAGGLLTLGIITAATTDTSTSPGAKKKKK